MSSKLLKSELKQIVKECLIEILQEGISNDLSDVSEKSIGQNIIKTSRRSSFDHASWANRQAEKDNQALPDYTEQAKSLTDNSILAEVLADSHKTMIGQIEAERMGKTVMAGDLATREAASSDPIDMFGDSAPRWASLAFDKK